MYNDRNLAICALAALVLWSAAACGYLAGRVPPPASEPRPVGAEEAIAIVSEVFAESFGVAPAIESVTWIYEDQCERGYPSIQWGGKCLSGLSLGCDLFVAVTAPLSSGALAHEIGHCAGMKHGDENYPALVMKAKSRLLEKGL